MRVLSGDGECSPDVLLTVLAQITTAERDPSRPPDRGSAAGGSTTVVLPAPLSPTKAIRLPGSSRRLNPSSAGCSSGCVSSADVFERDREGWRRGRRGLSRIADSRLTVHDLEDPSSRRERYEQLTCGRRERLNCFERRERQQRDHRDQRPVEVAGSVRRDRAGEHAGDRHPDDEQRRGRRRVHLRARRGEPAVRARRRRLAHGRVRRSSRP